MFECRTHQRVQIDCCQKINPITNRLAIKRKKKRKQGRGRNRTSKAFLLGDDVRSRYIVDRPYSFRKRARADKKRHCESRPFATRGRSSTIPTNGACNQTALQRFSLPLSNGCLNILKCEKSERGKKSARWYAKHSQRDLLL